jgi:hypothetical protein
MRRAFTVFGMVTLSLCLIAGIVSAADPATPTKDAANAKSEAAADASSAATTSAASNGDAHLAELQEQVAGRYKRFEEVLLRMAELTATSDPKRAALLRKTVAEGKQRRVPAQLEAIVELLKEDRLANAITGEQEVEQDLTKLLDLLLSEQRADKLKDERERLKQQVRKIKELINRQQQLQSQTEGAGDIKQLAESEGKLATEAEKLAAEMKGDEKKDATPSADAGKPAASKPKAESGDSQSGKPQKGKPNEGENGDDGKKSEGKKSSDKKSSDGQKGEKSQGSETPEKAEEDTSSEPAKPQPSDTPGQKRVAAAQQKMKDAQKKLDEAERRGAQQDQEDAIRELEQAKAELEEILRQMREEEQERVLAQLEARFRKMRDMQMEVYEGTQRLDRVPEADRTRNDEIESGRLSRSEASIVVEADKALTALRDEGTATALPEAVDQMREDMQIVTDRLAEFKVDSRTQGIEEDILAALEETIAALQKAQRDRDDKKQQASPQQGQPGEPPLVDRIAELKMIRALQMRVNTRTKRYSELVQGDVGQAEQEDLLQQLRMLAEREDRVYRATRDIVVGKNQ